MWAQAAAAFARPPFSNGHDRRYEAVKEGLRKDFGRLAINRDNKPRLKALAIARGVDLSRRKQPPLSREERARQRDALMAREAAAELHNGQRQLWMTTVLEAGILASAKVAPPAPPPPPVGTMPPLVPGKTFDLLGKLWDEHAQSASDGSDWGSVDGRDVSLADDFDAPVRPRANTSGRWQEGQCWLPPTCWRPVSWTQ